MNDLAAFAMLATALSPWREQLVFVGGWAHRLHRLHPKAAAPRYQPLLTLDADVAFSQQATLEGSIRSRLLDAGFLEQLAGEHRPPVSRYILCDHASGGFYAEFLTPLIGREHARDGVRIATLAKAGVTAQRLRYLDVLLTAPWQVTIGEDWGAVPAIDLRIPNPVSFIVQKLLIHDNRAGRKRAQDILYIHDTLELFGGDLDALAAIWRDNVRCSMHANWQGNVLRIRDRLFGQLHDGIRDAAVIPQDRNLDPDRMRAMCEAALGYVLE